jgi:hypothetical protein
MSNLAHYYTNLQADHEHQVAALVSTLAVASVAHPEEISLFSPNAIIQADLREQNPSVSYRYKYVLGCH